MNIEAAHPTPAPIRIAAAPNAPRAASFEAVLRQADEDGTRAELRDAVERLVSSALVLPALATMRESSLAADPFTPGTAEKRFGPLLDQRLADEVTASANFPVIDAITDELSRRYGLTPPETDAGLKEPLHA